MDGVEKWEGKQAIQSHACVPGLWLVNFSPVAQEQGHLIYPETAPFLSSFFPTPILAPGGLQCQTAGERGCCHRCHCCVLSCTTTPPCRPAQGITRECPPLGVAPKPRWDGSAGPHLPGLAPGRVRPGGAG